MSTSGKKPPGGEPLLGGDDDDFGDLSALRPVEHDFGAQVGQTRVAPAESVSKQSAVSMDQARARKLGVSMASTLIEPLPTSKVVFLELPGGSPVILSKSVTVLGRAAGVADVVIDDDGVSRQHAAILYAKSEFFLEDLQSSNGTKVDGQRITVVQLAAGTEFSIGGHKVRFMVRTK